MVGLAISGTYILFFTYRLKVLYSPQYSTANINQILSSGSLTMKFVAILIWLILSACAIILTTVLYSNYRKLPLLQKITLTTWSLTLLHYFIASLPPTYYNTCSVCINKLSFVEYFLNFTYLNFLIHCALFGTLIFPVLFYFVIIKKTRDTFFWFFLTFFSAICLFLFSATLFIFTEVAISALLNI